MADPPWLHIQRATPAERDALAAMLVANIAEEEENWPTNAVIPDLETARAATADALFGPAPAARALVAIAQREVIGAAFLCDLFPGNGLRRGWFLKQLFVAPDHRGRGVGTALIMHARHHAEEAGADRLELHTAPGNDGARRLYERLGMSAPPRVVYRFDL